MGRGYRDVICCSIRQYFGYRLADHPKSYDFGYGRRIEQLRPSRNSLSDFWRFAMILPHS
jgi:hypothetical protein